MHIKVIYCRICKSAQLKSFLPLGKIPLPNGFLTRNDLIKKESKFPLNVISCQNCGLIQLREIVNPEIMFRNYVYIPSSSQTRMQNFSEIASQAIEMVNPTYKSLVIDIGSNDGSLLSFFKGIGIRVLGIDPAVNLVKIAELKGITTLNDYISLKLAKNIRKQYGSANVITATNVVAHINDLYDLFSAVKWLLHKDGIFVCEFPYVLDLINNNQFDTIYHEHLSYFAVKPILYLLNKLHLKLVKIQRTAIDGGSLRLFISKNVGGCKNNDVPHFLKLEESAGIMDFQVLNKFNLRVKKLSKSLKNTLQNLKSKRKTIAAYGAAAKGNILLNYCKIGKTLIDFAVDSTPYKQGLFMPGTHIPIYPEAEIINRMPDYTLILAWNFADEIISKQKSYLAKGGKFIIPVPKVTIV